MSQTINLKRWLFFTAIVGIIAIGGTSCGGGYQTPQGVATAGTDTAPQSFGSEPQIGAPLDALKPGDKVWAMKKDGCYYSAKVTKLINERYYIHYDDGEKGRLKREKLAQWRISPGMPVEVLRSEGVWDKVVINSLAGENVAVQVAGGGNLKVVSLATIRVRAFQPN